MGRTPSNQVISVDVLPNGELRANYADGTWEVFPSHPGVRWLLKERSQFQLGEDIPISKGTNQDQWEAERAAKLKTENEEIVTDAMVDRFLSWPLPDSVCADLCATMQGAPHRFGTHLLTASEARQMLEHVLAAAKGEGK